MINLHRNVAVNALVDDLPDCEKDAAKQVLHRIMHYAPAESHQVVLPIARFLLSRSNIRDIDIPVLVDFCMARLDIIQALDTYHHAHRSEHNVIDYAAEYMVGMTLCFQDEVR